MKKIIKIKKGFLPFILIGILTTASCKKQSAFDYPPSEVSIYDIIAADNITFSTFQYAIKVAGLTSMLRSGDYTVFAPTNTALSGAGITGASIYAMDKDSLITMVEDHIVKGKVDIQSLDGKSPITSMGGLPLLIQKVGNATYVNGGDVTNTYAATNGTLYLIDNTLSIQPSILQRLKSYVGSNSNSRFTFLVAAITRASQGTTNFISMLDDSTQAYTLFAPNDGAFIDGGYKTIAAVESANPDTLGKLLLYHIIKGRNLMPDFDTTQPMQALSGDHIYFNKVKTNTWSTTVGYAEGINFYGGSANMYGGAGVIHGIPRFLPKPINMTTLQRIQSDTSLSLFNTALVAAAKSGGINFIKMLSDPDSSFTVFAISNKAFRAAGYTNDSLVAAIPSQLLVNMLEYHIIRGRINNIDVQPNTGVNTILTTINTQNNQYVNEQIMFVTVAPNFTVQGTSNDKSIVVAKQNANIVTTNGLLNIIDVILTP
ncbi:MAG: fasciclin domain-containing protein [Chitinophagaceae bacterium]|nr:MAG: fasciclin domain-containing protein [Chitinophagaceae bacterium]